MASVPQSPQARNPAVSVVIVGWNVREFLRACLESLRPAWAGGQAEVIVVDNASTDGTAALVRDAFPTVRLLANATNRGFGAANNQGMAAARGRYFFLLNPDTVVLPGVLETLVAFLDAHPQAGMAAPRLLNPDGSLQRNAFRFPGLAQVALDLFPLHPRLLESALNGRYPQERRATEPFAIDHPLGAALFVRRAVWEQTGGFDEGYFMYAEEVDWCRRIRQAGWSVWQVPAAEDRPLWRPEHAPGAGLDVRRALAGALPLLPPPPLAGLLGRRAPAGPRRDAAPRPGGHAGCRCAGGWTGRRRRAGGGRPVRSFDFNELHYREVGDSRKFAVISVVNDMPTSDEHHTYYQRGPAGPRRSGPFARLPGRAWRP